MTKRRKPFVLRLAGCLGALVPRSLLRRLYRDVPHAVLPAHPALIATERLRKDIASANLAGARLRHWLDANKRGEKLTPSRKVSRAKAAGSGGALADQTPHQSGR
jgi:hypothetical protein